MLRIRLKLNHVPSRFLPDWWVGGQWVGEWEELELRFSSAQQDMELGLGLSLAIITNTLVFLVCFQFTIELFIAYNIPYIARLEINISFLTRH